MSREKNNKVVLEDGSTMADRTTTCFRKAQPGHREPASIWAVNNDDTYSESTGLPLTRKSIDAWKRGILRGSERRPLTITPTRMSDNDDTAKDIDRRIKVASSHGPVFSRPGRGDVISCLTLFEDGRARHVPVSRNSQRLTDEAVKKMMWPTDEQKEAATVVAVYGAPISSQRLWLERKDLLTKGDADESRTLTTHQLGHNKESTSVSVDADPLSSLATYLTATAASKDAEHTLLIRRSEILDALVDPLFAAMHTSWTFDPLAYKRSDRSIGKDTQLVEVESWRIPKNPDSTLREQLASEVQLLTVSDTEKMVQELKESTEKKNRKIGQLLMLHIRNPESSENEGSSE